MVTGGDNIKKLFPRAVVHNLLGLCIMFSLKNI